MFNKQIRDTQNYDHSFANGKCGDFRNKFWGKAAPWVNQVTGRIPANIEETEQAYHIYLYAPGLQKEKISVSVKNDVLSVSYTGEGDAANKFVHAEHHVGNFERLFQLNNRVLTSNIQAAYSDGVLKITLAKDPDSTKATETVTIN